MEEMEMKKIHLFIVTLITFSLSALFVACEKDEEIDLTTISVSNEQFTPSYTSATLQCSFATKATLRNVYVQYATTQDFVEYDEMEMSKSDDVYSAVLDSLQDNTTYYVRYAVSNRYSSAMIEEISTFQTLQPSVPTITLKSISDIWDTHAKAQIALEFDGGSQISEMGICWNTQPAPVVENNKRTTKDTIAALEIKDLQPNTRYFVRSYAMNKVGVAYSEEYEFTTFSLPEIKTEEMTDVQLTTAMLHGTLVFNGNDTAAIKGFCWSTNEDPTVENNHIEIDTASAMYTYRLSNLIDETQYYVRAYAQNKIGIVYGETKSFTTLSALPPIVSINEVTDVDYHTATITAEVTSDGGADVTERGICYSTAENPTTESTKIISGKGTGSYTINLSNLQDSTTYYVRAYAINKKGIAYGEQKSFMTKGYMLPTITTANPTNVEYTSATVGGNISSDGGASVTECGICYSTTENPAIESNKIVSGKGTGSYTINLTDLQDSTTYYVRAYAINKKGIAYGEQVSFVTKGFKLPIVKTNPPINITYNSAIIGGDVISDGGLEIIERGICYSTFGTPTIEDTKIISNTVDKEFTIDLLSLSDSTLYYVRAYAINERGVGYGDEISFTTMKNYLPTIITLNPVNISYTSATIGGKIVTDGGSKILEQGICYSTSSNPTVSNEKVIADSSFDTFELNLVGLPNGTTYYARAYAINDKGIAYGNEVYFTTMAFYGTENGHNWVDLGLSIKWATENIGESGGIAGSGFAWGEVETGSYSWSTYKWCNGLPTNLTKYNLDSVNGLVDNKRTLEITDDAAGVNWGGAWRMPTEAEIHELINKCTWQIYYKGSPSYYHYYVVRGPNGNIINLRQGSYWSNSLDTTNTTNAFCLSDRYYSGAINGALFIESRERYLPCYVRPVCP